MKDSVELCQRFGRARQEDSSTVVMDERKDRCVAKLKQVKRRQDDIIRRFDPSKTTHNREADINAQKSREKTADSLLMNKAKWLNTPVAVLNLYVTKTKAILEHQLGKNKGQFHHEMRYKSVLRSVSATAVNNSKKQSKTTCALILLGKLRDATLATS